MLEAAKQDLQKGGDCSFKSHGAFARNQRKTRFPAFPRLLISAPRGTAFVKIYRR